MSTSEEQEAFINKDLILNLQNQRMIEQAFGTRVNAPKKPLSTVSEDAIREYNAQFKVVHYETETDPETGEVTQVIDPDTGRPKVSNKRFISVPPPELENVELKPIEGTDIERTERLHEYIIYANELIRETQDEIKKLQEFQREIEIELTNLPVIPKFDLSKSKAYNMNERDKVLKEIKFVKDANVDVQNRLLRAYKYIDEISAEVNKRETEEQSIISDINENKALQQAVDQRNRERIFKYQETMNLMNQGAFKEEKRQDESEQEYLDRLKLNAESTTVDEDKFNAQEFVRSRFKENLKELVRNSSIIEQVANELKSKGDEKEIEYKLIINKKIPLFKKTFIDTFGLNNKSITAGDIVEFIREFLLGNVDSIKQQAKIKNFQSSKFAESERTRMGEDTIPPENSYLTIQNPRNNKNLYIMIVLDRGDALNVLWSTQLKRHTFREIMGSHSLDSIKEQTGLNIGEIKRFLGMNNNPFTIASKILKSHPDIVPISYDASTPPYESVDVEYDENIMGWGVKTEKIPDKVPFGKVYIMLHKLYYKNILSLRRPDKTNFIGFPNTPVSDEFVHMIMQMVQHNATPKAGELKKLKTVEQHLYNRLIAISQLHKSHEIDSNGTIEHLKHQMQLILGEIEAGNDSKKVKLQLHNVVHALKNMGAITQKDAIDFIKQF